MHREVAATQAWREGEDDKDVGVRTRGLHQLSDLDESSDEPFYQGESSLICGYGDVSLSEAYNIPAPTTGSYPLRLKRDRPPMPRRRATGLRPTSDEEVQEEHSEEYNFSMDEENSLDSPILDFLSFLGTFEAARDASIDIHEATTLALGNGTFGHEDFNVEDDSPKEPGSHACVDGIHSLASTREVKRDLPQSNDGHFGHPSLPVREFSQRWEER